MLDIIEPTASVEQTPGIIEQAAFNNWRAGFFDFGIAKKNGTDYFNCGLVNRPDGLWLVTRRSRYVPGIRFGMNDVVSFLLNGKTPLRGVRVQFERRFPDEQWEDPRAIYHNGKTYISCCNFIWTNRGWTGAHQIISEISDGWQSVKRYDPDWANNGINIGLNAGHEKNWLWFFHDGLPHLVYGSSPHCVVRSSETFDPINCWFTPNELEWDYGQVRGGTPPIRVAEKYWTFFHSSLPLDGRKQYHMGAYAFEAKPPFRITRITSFPLLSGSKLDRSSTSKPWVVFPNGALLREGKWTVTMGVNDLDCAWVEIPHTDLERLTFPL